MSSSRQLAAIMFTDIVGYTSLMGEDEKKAFEFLKKNREIQRPFIEEHGGRWLKELGDGVMASFNTVSEAVSAAIKIQEATSLSNDFQLRIGIHQGEVVFESSDVFGDAVNIASRIQAIALPGSIFISGRVNADIKNQKEIQTVPMGKFTLKNVSEPIEIFAIGNTGTNIKRKAVPEKKAAESAKKCLMVLPFVNISNDPEQEYFSDGLTEELITNLSRLKGIKVLSRTTSMKYKGTKKDIKKIGKETDSGYILEGSVRNQAGNLRITAQFVDAKNDIHLWADTYSGTMDDIFDIQEKVSQKIVEALRVQLSGEEIDLIRKRYTDNTEAYQLYLQGRYFWKKRNEQALQSAVRLFEKAIEKDPDYALAWAGLADTYSLMGEFTNISRRELYPKTMAAVNKALEIDDRLAEAHISLAISLMLNEWDWVRSEQEFKLGIELDPNYATGHHWYAEWLLYNGRIDEAFREISLAVALDPVSQGILKDKGIHYYYTRQYDKAIDMAQATLELDSQFMPAHRLLSLSYEAKGMYDEAIAENEYWANGIGNKIKTEVTLAQIYAAAGRKEEAEKVIEELCEEKILTSNDNRGMALVYAALGDIAAAFTWLEKSYEMHEESLCSLAVDPKMDILRSDPRFSNLLERIGLKQLNLAI